MLNAAAPVVVGQLVGTRARLVESLRELDRVRDAALTARAEERARIGREIHDAVGHHITLIAVGAAALAASAPDDDTRRTAEHLHMLAKRSLGEVRSALGLPGGPLPGVPAAVEAGVGDVEALVAQWREAGLHVELADDGRPAALCPIVGRAAHRVVQESLTNAARHAAGAAVRVDLECGPRTLCVRAANAAPRAPREVVGRGGAGLAGLAERVGPIGGQLTAGPRPDGGFTVEAVLPVEAAAPV